MNTRKNSIRNWLCKCGILTLTAGMILSGTITKPVETYAVTFVQDTDGTKYAVDKKSGFYYVLSKSAKIYINAKCMGYEPEGMSDEQMAEMTKAFNLPR